MQKAGAEAVRGLPGTVRLLTGMLPKPETEWRRLHYVYRRAARTQSFAEGVMKLCGNAAFFAALR
jgi:hypothetical protein